MKTPSFMRLITVASFAALATAASGTMAMEKGSMPMDKGSMAMTPEHQAAVKSCESMTGANRDKCMKDADAKYMDKAKPGAAKCAELQGKAKDDCMKNTNAGGK